ncbi:MAG: DUF3616 domain-containing protein [Cyanobacteria bacterium P01_C01_bin.120]
MANGYLLSRALLKFQSESDDLLEELSAVARTPDGYLWVGSDEFLTVERLTPMGNSTYGAHHTFHLKDYINLHDEESEIDIEGLDYNDGYLWVVGSHSLKRNKPKGKKTQKDVARLAEIEHDPNRSLLARLPVFKGEILPTYADPEQEETLTAAALEHIDGHNILLEALAEDEHLGPFLAMRLPSKDNGFDIEGLAVNGNQIFLGLRGPVLRGWAIVLEIQVKAEKPGVLTLADLGDGELYRKHFLDLNGQGIRELCLYGNDLLILAGPTMALSGAMQLFRLADALAHSEDTLWSQESGRLTPLFDLPFTIGADNAEGLALVPCLGEETALMVVYDSPHPRRRVSPESIYADIFQLPELSSAD